MQMKQLEYTEYFVDSHSNYHAIKFYVNNKIKTFRVDKKNRAIEYNTRFWYRLTLNQEQYLLIWARLILKGKTILKADTAAFKKYKILGLPEEEVENLFLSMMFNNSIERRNRIFNIATISKKEYFLITLKQNIKRFFLWMMKK